MRIRSMWLSLIALTLPTDALASPGESATSQRRLEQCGAELLDATGWRPSPGQRWSLSLTRPRGSGALFYFGARHTLNSSDPQLAIIEAAFAAFSPTIVFYEGRPSSVLPDVAANVRTYGEPGFLRLLAFRASVPARTLEPDEPAVIAQLLTTYSPEQVQLFYGLRTAVQVRERPGVSEAEVERVVQRELLRGRAAAAQAGVRLPLQSLDELKASFQSYWPGRDWSSAEKAWFNPTLRDEETGGRFTNALNAAENHIRNRHMFMTLAAATLSGERVFAVVGRNHVPLQAAALECAIAG